MSKDKEIDINLNIEKQIKSVFSTLWEEEKPSDFTKFIPYVLIVIQIITLFLIISKK